MVQELEGRDENLTTGEVIMIILSGNCPRHHNAIMLELTDFDDSKISYLARISRGHHVDTLLVPREYKDTFESTELYKVLLPNISIGDVQFAKMYYYD